jgi:ferredoxin
MRRLAKLWQAFRRKKAEAPAVGGEKYVVARCIGCGQCANGCPLAVKIKKR